jgi:NAD-dependent DNA ligase
VPTPWRRWTPPLPTPWAAARNAVAGALRQLPSSY